MVRKTSWLVKISSRKRVIFTSPGKIGRFCGISIGKGITSASSSVRTCFFRMDREDIGCEATAREVAGDRDTGAEPLEIWEWRSWRTTDWDVMDVCTSSKIPSKRAICKFKSCKFLSFASVSWFKTVRTRGFTEASSSESIWNGWCEEPVRCQGAPGNRLEEPNGGRDERCFLPPTKAATRKQQSHTSKHLSKSYFSDKQNAFWSS